MNRGCVWWVRVWALCVLSTPTWCFYMAAGEGTGPQDIVEAISRMAQALEDHERHTTLYERVALLEETISTRSQTEERLQAEVEQLREKIPALEREIQTIPEMQKELANFKSEIGKLVQDYETKLSALASEVIRLKKNGQRRKAFETLSDGSNVLLRTAPVCPDVGLGMVGERVGNQCLYLSLTSQLNWTSAHRHCQQLGGDLAAPEDLIPLKAFLHQAFTRGPSLWLGASYQLGEQDGNEVERLNNPNSQTGTAEAKKQTISSSNLLPIPDPLQAEDSTSDPPIRDEMPPSLAMLIGEGPNIMLSDEGADVRQITGSGSFPLTRDQTAMLSEDPMVYGNMHSAILRHRQITANNDVAGNTAEDQTGETETDRSVVDVILLQDNGEEYGRNLPEHQNIEERSLPCNATENPECVTVEGDEGNAGETESSSVQDPVHASLNSLPSEIDDTRRQQKATMHCMLLHQGESFDYELVGKPCDEIHNFVCDLNFTFDNLLRE